MKVLNLTLGIPGKWKLELEIALNYVGLFPGIFSGFRDLFSGREGSVSTAPFKVLFSTF
jgi:hypothetical protein